MDRSVYQKIVAMAETPEAVERSIAYAQEHMGRFLKKKEKVLICLQKQDTVACRIMEETVLGCECTPVWLEDDFRWMTILKTAFTTKCHCIIGPPLLMLGLSKVAKHLGTPLFARNVVVSGYPATRWMVEGIEQGLDCRVWGCFDPGFGAVIAGFSCGKNKGVHLRTEEYGADVVDDAGEKVPEGQSGNLVLYPKADPALRYGLGDQGRMAHGLCRCGSDAPRLLDLETVKFENRELSDLGESLLCWSSILDCRIEKTECGLELELVVFKGEKLPKLPTAARLIVRAFNPETDAPFAHHEVLKRRYLS